LHYPKGVTLKIEKTPGEGRTIIKLIGRIRAEHLDDLKAQITASLPEIVLELGEVSLVDADAVRFLSACELEGIQLLNCSAYIREWIVREQESSSRG
jgi:anti-anti-sigma regulatory factor